MFRKDPKIIAPIPTSRNKRSATGELQEMNIALQNNLLNKENMLEMAAVTSKGIRYDINSDVKK